MALLTTQDRHFLTTLSKFCYCNPFLLENFEYQRELLGRGEIVPC